MVADRGFTGHEYLKYFNLYYMNGRMYDPLVGRFLSADPYVQASGQTQAYNRYSYCLNNPLRYIDPTGYRTVLGRFFHWVGENAGTIGTVAYLAGAAVTTVFCPVAGMAMFGAYLGGMTANDGKINMGKWDWKDPTTYVGIGIGGAMGALGGQLLFGEGGVLAGGTTLDVSLSATFENVGAVFADINVGAAGISLADVGYVTVAGGGAILTGMALKDLFNNHGIKGVRPTNESPHNNGPFYEERGEPWNPEIKAPNNKSYFPEGPDWLKWIVWPGMGWTVGYELYKKWPAPDIPAPTTTDKTPQIGPKK